MDVSVLSAVAMGFALSATCGFRVFIPLLAASIASRAGLHLLPESMGWVGSWPALICFGVAAAAEVAAYYIPFVDNLLDTIATPLSVGAGTVVAASFLPLGEQEPMLRWIAALIAGGAPAGVIQMGTGVLRLLSSKATVGTGNAVVATSENAAAVSGSVLSFFIPFVMAGIALLLLLWLLARFGKTLLR